jgi:4-amino-4-deoxy-L-arabinose transferase
MKTIKEHHWAIIIFVIAVLLRLYAAHMDSFLHEWDERFHALVARNMMENPFHPLLIKIPFESGNSHDWSSAQLWLHKQPLFMWQMAASMKLFGVSEFAIRLPSAMMGALMILLLYRITLILTNNKLVSSIAALLLCFSNYQLQLISGIEGMDHNDIAFEFYMLASCWAYAEYCISKKWYWVIIIGLLSGCAIFNKWLIGLAVFLGWGINMLYQFYKTKSINQLGWMMLALLICCAVFIPWQIYTILKWPTEAWYELNYNSKHITEVIEGHSGTTSYYFDAIELYVGKYIGYLFPLGVLFFIRDRKFNIEVMIAITSIFVFVICFLSFVVLTKIHSHIFFIVPFALISIAYAVVKIITSFNNIFFKSAIIIGLIYFSIQPNFFINYLSKENKHRESCIQNANAYRNIDKLVPENIHIVININALEHINLMFYHPEYQANNRWLSDNDLIKCKAQKQWIAAFQNHENYNLPEQILNYPYLYIIKTELK